MTRADLAVIALQLASVDSTTPAAEVVERARQYLAFLLPELQEEST